MSSPEAIENKNVADIPSLLVPIAGRNLLLPTVTVAEMVPYTPPHSELDAPDWYLGAFVWRELAVPLISFEVINGESRPQVTAHSRVAVLNNTGINDELPFIALPTLGIPRLARVSQEEINQIVDAVKKPFELMHVSVAGERAVIPDIDSLEKAYLDFRQN
jgi:chemosensory pili system protein ChpC